MADPVAGLVQMGANLPGVKSLVGDSVNAGIAGNEAQYEAARQAAGRSGFDAARLVGNVAAPSNVSLLRACRWRLRVSGRDLLALLLARSVPR